MKRAITMLLVIMLLIGSCASAFAEDKAFAAYDEPVVMNIMASNDSTVWYPEGEGVEKNILIDYYRDRLNIDIESTWITDKTNYTSQIDLMIAGDNLPDVFYATPEQLYRLVQAGQIQPIGDVYAEYASEDVKNELGDVDGVYFEQGKVDGQVYGFPIVQDYCTNMPIMYIRGDWLEKVGMEAPKTWAEYEAVMDAFMSQCGAKYGAAIPADKKYSWDVFFSPYGAHYQSWDTAEDGSLIFSGITEGTKSGLTKMNEWYNKGYLSPEFATSTLAVARDDLAQGNTGIFCCAFYPGTPTSELFKSTPDLEWVACPIPSDNGEYSVEAFVAPTQFVVVNAKYEHPEAMIKYMNLWEDMWRGESGSFYHEKNLNEYANAGENFKFYVPFYFDPPMKNMLHSTYMWEIFPDGDTTPYEGDYEFMKQFDAMSKHLDGTEPSLSGYLHILCYMKAFKLYHETYKCETDAYISAFTGPLSEDYANYKAIADGVSSEYYMAAVMGAKNLEKDWDSFQKTWLASGGEYITEYVNEWKLAQ